MINFCINRLKSFLFFLVLIICLSVTFSCFAQNKEENQPGALGITLIQSSEESGKAFFQYELKPGQAQEDAILIFNNSKTPMDVVVYSGDAVNSNTGSLSGTNREDPLKGVGTWIRLHSTKARIAPGDRQVFRFTLSVPADSTPGDHLGFIFVEPDMLTDKNGDDKKPEAGENKVSFGLKVKYRLGVSVWQRTPGDHKRGLEFGQIKKVFKDGRLFLDFPISNPGNLFVKSIVGWKLKDSKGTEFMAVAPQLMGFILPGNTVEMKIPVISDRPVPRGTYSLEVSLSDEKSDYKELKSYEITLP